MPTPNFDPMLLQMQGFFKDMNAICTILNIGQPVLQIMTVLSFVSWVLKNDMKVLNFPKCNPCNEQAMILQLYTLNLRLKKPEIHW